MATIYDMPNHLLNNVNTNEFMLEYIQQRTTNYTTGYERRSLPTDVRWAFEMSLGRVSERIWKQMEAFFDKVQMESGFFTAYDPAHAYPRGVPTEAFNEDTFSDGTVYSDGYGYAATNAGPKFDNDFYNNEFFVPAGLDTIVLKNLKPGEISFRAGDMLSITQINIPMLHRVVSDTNPASDDGRNTVHIVPQLRADTELEANIEILRPRGVFQFVGDLRSRRRTSQNSRVRFRAIEVPEVWFMSPRPEVRKA